MSKIRSYGKLWVRVVMTFENDHQSPTKLSVPSLDTKFTACNEMFKNKLGLRYEEEVLQKGNAL